MRVPLLESGATEVDTAGYDKFQDYLTSRVTCFEAVPAAGITEHINDSTDITVPVANWDESLQTYIHVCDNLTIILIVSLLELNFSHICVGVSLIYSLVIFMDANYMDNVCYMYMHGLLYKHSGITFTILLLNYINRSIQRQVSGSIVYTQEILNPPVCWLWL